jgi:hypothetical protein
LVYLERQERWAYLVPPGLQVFQALTVQPAPPASLEFLVPLVQPGSTGQQALLELLVSQVSLVLPELLVFQELLVRLVLRAQQGQPALTVQAVLLEQLVLKVPLAPSASALAPQEPQEPQE